MMNKRDREITDREVEILIDDNEPTNRSPVAKKGRSELERKKERMETWK